MSHSLTDIYVRKPKGCKQYIGRGKSQDFFLQFLPTNLTELSETLLSNTIRKDENLYMGYIATINHRFHQFLV